MSPRDELVLPDEPDDPDNVLASAAVVGVEWAGPSLRERVMVNPLRPICRAVLKPQAERRVRGQCLSKLILIGEGSLRRVLAEYPAHYHAERNHQGVGNVILFPGPEGVAVDGSIRCRVRLGGTLRFYNRDAG